MKKQLIDTEKAWIPEGYELIENTNLGKIDIKNISLYLSEKQNGSIKGEDLLKELKDKKPLNSAVLKYLLDNPKLIPEDWKEKNVYFWGTILRSPLGDRCVLFLYWNGSEWGWYCDWLENDRDSSYPSAVLAIESLTLESLTLESLALEFRDFKEKVERVINLNQ